MSDDPQALAIEGVRFFGEMTASLSHEIKNVLAIINENAGLLQDLVGMAERGRPLCLERLSKMSRTVAAQVERGDRIVRNLNRLAHSADHPRESVDVGELIGFVVALTGRLIAMRGPAPSIAMPPAPVTVVTHRFFLEHLVWACLRRVLESGTADRALTVTVEGGSRQTRIRFQGLCGQAAGQGAFPSPQVAMVADLLGVHVAVDTDNGEIGIIFS